MNCLVILALCFVAALAGIPDGYAYGRYAFYGRYAGKCLLRAVHKVRHARESGLSFFLNLRLLFLAVLESGAPLSSSLEEALYKCSV